MQFINNKRKKNSINYLNNKNKNISFYVLLSIIVLSAFVSIYFIFFHEKIKEKFFSKSEDKLSSAIINNLSQENNILEDMEQVISEKSDDELVSDGDYYSLKNLFQESEEFPVLKDNEENQNLVNDSKSESASINKLEESLVEVPKFNKEDQILANDLESDSINKLEESLSNEGNMNNSMINHLKKIFHFDQKNKSDNKAVFQKDIDKKNRRMLGTSLFKKKISKKKIKTKK
ncbi:hypothetical protein AXA84_0196 [Candidatus Phytoplasma oryzae]|uniref:Uncharacterized protein n=1 Tax=Candidatus Phytoplasma oryzae TaxID=203274 RepID=A0A139JQR0_9MOLU|nr:hypothetical protein [Candidatus Phytoplasma oryzae]KXT29302.1 hypothetical protein AXA84_0196 [Candidatus Phytoplasma oryzae]RAM57567.1 hypothetical protein DH96_02365 [Candidatus Phytoplasma oryzae]